VGVTVDPKYWYLSIYDESQYGWKLVAGTYTFLAGGPSQDLPLHKTVTLK
jgi:beta-glucosidase